MKNKKFCDFCGKALIDRYCDGRTRLYCASCDQPIYENPIPATCIVVSDPLNRILLVKRNIEPKFGQWCLPGGFMELDETPERCALRELKEETGLSGRIDMLLGVSASPNRQYGTVIMLGYRVAQISGSIKPGDDVSEAAFFQHDALPDIAFESHRQFIRIYFAAYKT